MYFLLRYFLSSLPSVSMFPLFTIKSKHIKIKKKRKERERLCLLRTKLRKNCISIDENVFYLQSICRKTVLLYAAGVFCLTERLDSHSLNILRKLPKWFWSWTKTSLISKYNFIDTNGIFHKTAVIYSVHNFLEAVK